MSASRFREKGGFNLNAGAHSKEFDVSLLSLQQHNLCSMYFDDLLKKSERREYLFV